MTAFASQALHFALLVETRQSASKFLHVMRCDGGSVVVVILPHKVKYRLAECFRVGRSTICHTCTPNPASWYCIDLC